MDILNLSHFSVLNISENEHDILIQVETNTPPSHCPHYGCVASVGLLIKRQRYKCRECNKHCVTNAYSESVNSLIRVINRLGRGYSFEALRAKILFTEGLAKQRKPKYQRRIDDYVLEENFPMFKMPPVIREPEETTLLGIDLSTLIEKLEKGEL